MVSKVKTWLSLDEWAEIIGINPLHFNQLYATTYFSGVSCDNTWYQYSWQGTDKIGRDDVAQAIRQAEQKIAGVVGYNLLPDWEEDERQPTVRPSKPTVYNYESRNARLMWKSVRADKAHIISGGYRSKVGIETVAVVRYDDDSDSYFETVRIVVGTSVTDPDEIKVYYPGESGADEWEIRPIDVTIDEDAAQATIEFKSWQILKPDFITELAPDAKDAEDDTVYLATVDVYWVYNNPATQCQLMWESDYDDYCACTTTCYACQHLIQNACLRIRDFRLSEVAYIPGTYDSSSDNFTRDELTACREPDAVRLWYYSGWQDKRLAMPKSHMDKFWKDAVAFFACALLDRPLCGCSNIEQFVLKWKADRAQSPEMGVGYAISRHQLDNKLGSTTMGALYALARVEEEGRIVGR